MKKDVVVIGSGAAGLSTAFSAADAGLDVLVIEASDKFGGTTALSGGGVWVPSNRHQKDFGIDDSPDQANEYLKNVLGDYYDEERVGTYVRSANQVVAYLEKKGALLLYGTDMPDYEPHLSGACKGRTCLAANFDGNELGDDFDKIRPPIPEIGLFSSMQLGLSDVVRMRFWSASVGNALFVLRRLISYSMDRLRGRRGREMAMGNALVGRLFKAARDAGVSFWDSCPATKLLIEDGRVVGVEVIRAGKKEIVHAAKGVVLACGGFSANSELRLKHMPHVRHGWSFQPETCQGDGIKMGVEAGGVFDLNNVGNGIWIPASACRREDGSTALFPSLLYDRHCPGSIMIDASSGQRFIDESNHYQAFGYITYSKGIEKVWMISDATAVSKYGIGMVKPKPFSPDAWVKKGYVKKANTIEELASLIGVDKETLIKMVRDFNDNAKDGKDPLYHRGESAISAYMGDPQHKPNPTVGPLLDPPFYALEIRTSTLASMAGLKTNANSQVVNSDGEIIEGLYAAGADNNSIGRGYYPGGGLSIGPALTFGRLAALHMAGLGDK